VADNELRQAVGDFLDSPMDASGWALSNLIRVYDATDRPINPFPEDPPEPETEKPRASVDAYLRGDGWAGAE
jgi:hypothetical protein